MRHATAIAQSTPEQSNSIAAVGADVPEAIPEEVDFTPVGKWRPLHSTTHALPAHARFGAFRAKLLSLQLPANSLLIC